MKFMTKEEYQRKINTRANYLASTSYAMRIYYDREEAKYTLLDRIKIKLGLKAGNKIRVTTTSKFFRHLEESWMKSPVWFHDVETIKVRDKNYIVTERVIGHEKNPTLNKFDYIPNPTHSKEYYEKEFNDTKEEAFQLRKQWQKQVWMDRIIRFTLLASLFWSVNYLSNPFPNIIWQWVIALFATMYASKILKFIVLDSLKSRDFDFWETLYVDKREWHYFFRCIVVFALTYAYTSIHMIWLSDFEYTKVISAFLIYIIGNHLWFKYETDPVKKALK